jgi:hypothetical protein
MMMKKKLVYMFALTSALLLLAFSTTPISAAPNYKIVGVRTGDTATYSYNTNMPDPVNQTSITTSIILGVSGTQVTLLRNYIYPNGSSYGNDILNENISQYTLSGHIWLRLLPANLSVGDPIQVGSSLTVDQTFTATFAGMQRTVNNVTFMSSGMSCGKEYDKETGLFLASNLYLGSNHWENVSLISTTLWSAPSPAEPISLLSVGLGAIVGLVVGVAIGFVIKRRK